MMLPVHQVADAAEQPDLDARDERDRHGDVGVRYRARHEADHGQHDGLRQHRPPQWVREMLVDAARFQVCGQQHTGHERQDGPDVCERGDEVAFTGVHGEEDDVSGLDVGEHVTARDVGVRVEEGIGRGEQQRESQGGGRACHRHASLP
jgi:hypothetical protein